MALLNIVVVCKEICDTPAKKDSVERNEFNLGKGVDLYLPWKNQQ
jgi:hypothetical protein